MPIQPPRGAGVQLLSPASLLGSRQQRQNPMATIMNQMYQTRMQEMYMDAAEERARIAQQGADTRSIDAMVAAGQLHRKEDVDLERYTLPGEEGARTPIKLPEVTLNYGIGDERQQRTYIRGSDISAAQNAIHMAGPAGEGFFDDVTRGDIVAAAGSRSAATGGVASTIGDVRGSTGASASQDTLNQYRIGDKELTIGRLESLLNDPEEGGFRGSRLLSADANIIQNEIDRIKGDDRFTRAEQLEVMDRFGPSQIDAMHDNFFEMVKENAKWDSEVGSTILDYTENYQVVETRPDGSIHTRDLNLPEAAYLAAYKTARHDNDIFANVTPEEIQDFVGAFSANVRKRTTVADVATELSEAISNIGLGQGPLANNFVQVMNSRIFGEGNEVLNSRLFSEISDAMGVDLNRQNMAQWMRSPASFNHRAAFALYNRGYQTRSEFERNYLNVGGKINFGMDGVSEAAEDIIPGFNDSDGIGTPRQTSGTGSFNSMSAEDRAKAVADRREVWNGALTGVFNNIPQDSIQGIDRTFNLPHEDVVRSISGTVETLDSIAADAGTPQEEKQEAQRMSTVYKTLLEVIETPEGLSIFLNDIWNPWLEQTFR